ncbi:hypothetical protein ACFQNF_16325 [Iodobacter arcticus]|uniref:Uncharacterized protein n=1 Tax=Iodobacter arcticus TaxID=590593 RepID=A0ABW2R0Z6_9NEIS
MFISFEKNTCGACLAGLLVLGFSQLSFAADDVLGSELATHHELELATPLALGQQRGSDRRGDVVIDRRMFKLLRAERNADILPSQKERELQESEELRSKLTKSAFAEALEKAKQEEEARADRAKREQDYLEIQQRQRYECIPVPNQYKCAPQVSGVPFPRQGRLFP